MKQEKLKELLESLTLQEKIGQLLQFSGEFYKEDVDLAVGPQQKLGVSQAAINNAGSILNVLGAEKVKKIQNEYLKNSRHKIPLLFMADIIYGYHTIFPIPLSLGCTWEPQLIKEIFNEVAKEASEAGAHVTFAPMVDVVRDARWGRCMESTGEDTYLNSQFAKAMVEGFQGEFKPGESIASCVKHFAAYGAAEAGREYNTVDMSERRLRQDYLPPYKAAVDAGCEMVMTSFNTIDDIPATANKWLMKDVLRDEWGFDGVLISDYAAVQELIAHGIAENDREAAKLSIEATLDIDMKTPCYANHLEPLIKDGEISEEYINEAVWRILKLKNKLGLFENPYLGIHEALKHKVVNKEKNHKLARTVASKAIVLLKNENNVLPLKKESKVALIGPYADSKDLIGLWAIHGNREESVTIKSAFEEELGKDNLLYAKGCDTLSDYSLLGDFGNISLSGKTQQMTPGQAKEELEHAISIAKQSDVVVLALGEHMLQSGEAGSRTDIKLPDIQQKLLNEIHECGKPIVLIVFNGRPLVLTEVEQKVDSIIEGWFPGTEGGHAIADVIFGKVNPSGKLTMSFPYAVGQVPVYYNYFNTGRPLKTSTHSGRFVSRYLDSPNDPLYCFGYGLSYTNYEYRNLVLNKKELRSNDSINVTIEVTNTGTMQGEEIVQLYIQDIKGSVVRPIKELKDFGKLHLEPGETKQIFFEITEEKLKFYTKDKKFAAEEGKFKVFVGPNSEDLFEDEFTFIR